MKGKGRRRKGRRGGNAPTRTQVDPTGTPHPHHDGNGNGISTAVELESEPNQQSTGPLHTFLLTRARSIVLNKVAGIATLTYLVLLQSWMASFIATLGENLLNQYPQSAWGFLVDLERCGEGQLKHHGTQKWLHLLSSSVIASLQVSPLLLAWWYSRFVRASNAPTPRTSIFAVLGALLCTVIATLGVSTILRSSWHKIECQTVSPVLSVVFTSLDLPPALSFIALHLRGTSPNQVIGQNSFETLEHSLSSRGGREMLQLLISGGADSVIDDMEKASREDSPLRRNIQKTSSLMVKKISDQLNLLPKAYIITDDLKRIGPYPFAGGGYADVWRGTYQGSPVAIKVLRTSEVNFLEVEKKFCREVVIWKQFKHPNLLLLIGVKKVSNTLMMVSKWVEYGTLTNFVKAFPGTNRLKLLADTARGLRYLHEWPSVHGDLNGNNILIDQNFTALISDFGLASLLRPPLVSMTLSAPEKGGTVQWMAPELLDENPPSRESDIYALAMVIYQVFAHQPPFASYNKFLVPSLVLDGDRPLRPTDRDILGLSDDVWVLTKQCWDKDPNNRPNITDTLDQLEVASRSWVSPSLQVIANLFPAPLPANPQSLWSQTS